MGHTTMFISVFCEKKKYFKFNFNFKTIYIYYTDVLYFAVIKLINLYSAYLI